MFCAPILKLSHPIFMSCGNPPNTNPPRLDLLLLLLLLLCLDLLLLLLPYLDLLLLPCLDPLLDLRVDPPPLLLNAHAERGGLNGVASIGPVNSETGTGCAVMPILLGAKKLPPFPPFHAGPTAVVRDQPPQPPFLLLRLRLCLLRRVFMV